MNKRERRILYYAAAAIRIPHQGNRASVKGASGYDNDMREVERIFGSVIESLLDGELDDAENSLNRLVAEYKKICERIDIGVYGPIRDYQEKINE